MSDAAIDTDAPDEAVVARSYLRAGHSLRSHSPFQMRSVYPKTDASAFNPLSEPKFSSAIFPARSTLAAAVAKSPR